MWRVKFAWHNYECAFQRNKRTGVNNCQNDHMLSFFTILVWGLVKPHLIQRKRRRRREKKTQTDTMTTATNGNVKGKVKKKPVIENRM